MIIKVTSAISMSKKYRVFEYFRYIDGRYPGSDKKVNIHYTARATGRARTMHVIYGLHHFDTGVEEYNKHKNVRCVLLWYSKFYAVRSIVV